MKRTELRRKTPLRSVQGKPRKRQRNTGPSAAMVRKVRERDGWRCVHCGTTENLTTGHRKNRGSGGSSDPAINRPSNLITECAAANALSESDAGFRLRALEKGWKVLQFKDPRLVRCWVLGRGPVFLLDDGSFTFNPETARAAVDAAERQAS